MVQSGAECIMTSPTPAENIRLTITVTPEVHATFTRFSKASGMSLGRCMGEWLGDTLEGAELLASQLERARAAPKAVIREMQAFSLGLHQESNALMAQLQEEGRRARADAKRSPGSGSRIPPSSNTGGKGQKQSEGKVRPPRSSS